MFFNFLFNFSIFYLIFKSFKSIFFFFFLMVIFFWKMTNILEFNYYNINFNYDLMGYMLSVLSFFLIYFVILNLWGKIGLVDNILIIFLLKSLIMCFLVDSMIIMYIFFEVSLMPLIVLIFFKGASKERFLANMYMLLYTLLGSFYLLLVINFISSQISMLVNLFNLLNSNKGVLWLLMILVFLIKMPMYSFHLWLPKAHVEASVEGSMLLAGVFLKLGGYGYYRILSFINLESIKVYLHFLFSLSILGSLITMLICLRQMDIKMMIAYSSVVHMGLVLCAMLSLNKLGSWGVLGMMIGHGFCSSGLFYVGNLFYNFLKTRNMMVIKGLFQIFYSLLLLWMVLVFCNMGVPPFMNFFSELLLIFSLMKFSLIYLLIYFLFLFFSVVYGLMMYLRVSHGFFIFLNFMFNISIKSYILIFLHMVFLLFYLLFNYFFFCWV